MESHIFHSLHCYVLLIEAKKKYKEIESIPLNRFLPWLTNQGIALNDSYAIKSEDELVNILREKFEFENVSRKTYRMITSYLYKSHFENKPVSEFNYSWIEVFHFLFNLSFQISPTELDHQLLIYNSSQELLSHYVEPDLMHYEGDRIKSQLTGLFYSLKIYEDYMFYNWRFIEQLDNLILARFKEIIKNDEAGELIGFHSPRKLFY